MGLQSATQVRVFQTTGQAGEIAREGPVRAAPWQLDSTAGGDPNTIGFAFTKKSDGVALAGGVNATDIFVGILVRPKEYALRGTTAGTLEASTDIPDFETVDLLTMGIIYAGLDLAVGTATGLVGDLVHFRGTTGELTAFDPGVSPPAGFFPVVGATVVLEDITGSSVQLAIIQLT